MKCSTSYTLVVVSDGASVKGITAYYALSSSSETAPSTSEFTTEVKTPTAEKRYLWSFEETTYSDDSTPTRTEPIVIGTYVTDGKDAPKVLVEYQYSASDRTPPTKLTVYKVNGYLVSFADGVLGDDNSTDWSTDPSTLSAEDSDTWETDPSALVKDTSKPYLWMRVSTDGGQTWQYSVVTGPKASFFEILSSKDTFRQNARGAVDIADEISFWVVRHNIEDSEKCTWGISPDTLTIDSDSVNADRITITIPVGFSSVGFTVTLSVGSLSETLSKTVYGMAVGTISPVKLTTITDKTLQVSDYPKYLSDGVSPVKDGDYMLVTKESDGKDYLIPYRYSEKVDTSTGTIEGWVVSSAEYENHSQIMGNCLQEVLANSQTVPSTSAMYGFFQSLVANDAFVKLLCAQYLEIQGAIYGGALDKDGNKRNYSITVNGEKVDITSGFFLDYIGRFVANNATLNDVNIINKNKDDAILLNTQYTNDSSLVTGDTITATKVAFSDLSDTNLVGGSYELNKKKGLLYSYSNTSTGVRKLGFTAPYNCTLWIEYDIRGSSSSLTILVNYEAVKTISGDSQLQGYFTYQFNSGEAVQIRAYGEISVFEVGVMTYVDNLGNSNFGSYKSGDSWVHNATLYFDIEESYGNEMVHFPYAQLGSYFSPEKGTSITSDGKTLDNLVYAIDTTDTTSFTTLTSGKQFRRYLLESTSWINSPRTGQKPVDCMDISSDRIYFLKGSSLVFTLEAQNRFEFHYSIKLLYTGDGIAISNVYRSPSFSNSSIGTSTNPFEYAHLNNVYGTFMSFQQLLLLGAPTSSDGLAIGTVWNDNGTLKIKQ